MVCIGSSHFIAATPNPNFVRGHFHIGDPHKGSGRSDVIKLFRRFRSIDFTTFLGTKWPLRVLHLSFIHLRFNIIFKENGHRRSCVLYLQRFLYLVPVCAPFVANDLGYNVFLA